MKNLRWLTRERAVAGRRAPAVLDWLLTLVLSILALLEAAGGMYPGPVAVAAMVQIAAIVPIAFRRLAPVRAIAIGVAISLPYVVLYGSANSLASLLAGLLFSYSVGRHAHGRGLVAGAAIALFSIIEQGFGGTFQSPTDWAFAIILMGAALAFGVALRVQVERSIVLAIAADRAQREQEATAQAAVHEERARIARELHDVVAHNVGLIVLQAGGARSVLDTDPERARAALRQVEETGRQTLTEMRHLVAAPGAPARPGRRGTCRRAHGGADG
jgi:signal transduction histidine kinase